MTVQSSDAQISDTAIDSAYARWRLTASLLAGAIGGVGMWCIAVVLPAVQAEFNTARGGA